MMGKALDKLELKLSTITVDPHLKKVNGKVVAVVGHKREADPATKRAIARMNSSASLSGLMKGDIDRLLKWGEETDAEWLPKVKEEVKRRAGKAPSFKADPKTFSYLKSPNIPTRTVSKGPSIGGAYAKVERYFEGKKV